MDKADLLSLYRQMLLIRRFEEKSAEMYALAKIAGFLHLYIGEEAIAVGAIAALRPDDYAISAYRDHGHCLARGSDPGQVMAELFGKATGLCQGKGGSMHLVDAQRRFMGGYAIVGGHIPLATGLAFATKYQHLDLVTVCFFGEGAVPSGQAHEAFNLAALWKLPVIFVCENNLYGEFTAGKDVTSVKDIADRARGHDMPGIIVNGNDVTEVYETTVQAVERARRGEGPSLIECKTYRWEGHVVGEEGFLGKRSYRSAEEIEEWKKRCPLIAFESRFLSRGMCTQTQLDTIKAEVKREIDEAVAFAQDSPLPNAEEALEDMFSVA